MQYSLQISRHNQQPHIDIENDIQARKNGLFTFILRVNNGNIVDYNVMEYTNGEGYVGFTEVARTKLALSHGDIERGAFNAFWSADV